MNNTDYTGRGAERRKDEKGERITDGKRGRILKRQRVANPNKAEENDDREKATGQTEFTERKEIEDRNKRQREILRKCGGIMSPRRRRELMRLAL